MIYLKEWLLNKLRIGDSRDIQGSLKSFIIKIPVGCPHQKKKAIRSPPLSVPFMYVKLSLRPIWIDVYGGRTDQDSLYSSLLKPLGWSFKWPSMVLNIRVETSTDTERDVGCNSVSVCVLPRGFLPFAIWKRGDVSMGDEKLARSRQLQISTRNPLFNVGVLNGCLISKLRQSRSTLGFLSEDPIVVVKSHLVCCCLRGTPSPSQLWVIVS